METVREGKTSPEETQIGGGGGGGSWAGGEGRQLAQQHAQAMSPSLPPVVQVVNT